MFVLKNCNFFLFYPNIIHFLFDNFNSLKPNLGNIYRTKKPFVREGLWSGPKILTTDYIALKSDTIEFLDPASSAG
jgi:hypothetical protein